MAGSAVRMGDRGVAGKAESMPGSHVRAAQFIGFFWLHLFFSAEEKVDVVVGLDQGQVGIDRDPAGGEDAARGENAFRDRFALFGAGHGVGYAAHMVAHAARMRPNFF